MTKIKNTKKGMAKKTLSMSLVVAMLATSNVPVWAAEFSDGTDAAVTSEAPAADVETFSDDTESTPAVDNTEVATETVAATATEKLNVTTAEVSVATVLAGDLKNNEGTDVTTFDYKWLVDGVEPANESGEAVNAYGHSDNGISGINAFTPGTNHSGKSLTLEITGTGTFEGFTYTTPAVTIKSRDITKVVESISSTATLRYDGTAKTLSANDVRLTYKNGVTEAEKALVTASAFTFAYNGDTVNATESGKNIKVIATINKAGYTGSIAFTITIGKKTSANSSENDLNDKDKNDLAVNMKKTQYKYTGNEINFTTNVEDNFTLKSNISGNTLSSKAVTSVTPVTRGVTLKEVGSKDKVKVGIDVSKDKELNKNYESTAFIDKYYYAPEEVSVIARDLSTCTIDNISVGSLKAKDITKAEIKDLIAISEGKETLVEAGKNNEFKENFDIEVNVDDIKKGGEGAYDVIVKPKDTTKNIVGKKTIKLYVTQNDIATATLTSTGAQLENNSSTVTKDTTLNENTVFADEYYQGGTAITKTADQLGTIIIGSEGTVLKEGTDYKLVYKNNTKVGTAEIWIQGTGSTFSGSKCIGKFSIVVPEIKAASITVPKTVTYDGSKTAADEYLKKSDVKVQAEAYTWSKNAAGTFVKTKKLIDVPETLYDVAFTPASGVKDGSKLTTTVKKAANVDEESDNYKNYVANTNFKSDIVLTDKTTVSTTSIANTTVTVVGAPFVYTGKEITPDLVVKDGDRTLVKDVDYEVVTTVNAKNAGTAKITIKGKGDYSKTTTKTVEFTINKADLSKVTITPKKSAADDFKYTGNKLTPDITDYDIKLGDVTLDASDENIKVVYPASSSANVNAGKEAGSATLVVKDTAKNPNFEGTNAFKFDITQADLTTGGTFTLWKDGKVVGLAKTPTTKPTGNTLTSLDVLFTNDGTEHTFDKVTYTPVNSKYKEGTDYEVKYYNNVRGEIAAIYVNALGNYKNADANRFADNKTTYTDARFFKIGSISIKKSDVKVANTEYAGGIAVKPTVTVTVNGKTLVDDSDYKIETVGDAANVTATDKILTAKLYAKDGYVLDTTTWGNDIKSDTNGKQYVELKWKVVAKNLKNTTVTVDKDGNVTVMNGSVVVPSSEYDVKFSEDGKKVTVTAKADSKNYTGSKEVDVNAVKVGAPVISNVKVSGNKATIILSGEADEAAGYDYVISTSKDPSDKDARVDVIKNQVQTTSTFKYVQQGTYYAYCHAWKRDANGKKVFSDWSNAYPFVVSAITPDAPVITNVKVSGSTIKVTYKAAANATGYDVVLGTSSKKENGETRPYNYGAHKVLNLKEGTVTATFKNVPKGTWTVGMHAFNRTSEDGKKVFSPWSNLKKATVK